jgi:hypothetical protein
MEAHKAFIKMHTHVHLLLLKERDGRSHMAKVIKAAGEKHTIKKDKKGDIIVDHAGKKGKYDKINLTKKAGAKTVKAGVKATKDWHKKNG